MYMLIVVGSGIKSISHLTEETKRIIQQADKVLFLVNEDNLKTWILREAKESESLEPIYFATPKRIDAYHNITNHIVDTYHQVKNLCVVFYGHPTVFAESALTAVKRIKEQTGQAIVLPAISSMDCLFADLQIDPGDQGCFAIDATELLIYERRVDVYAHIILWQISNLGMHDTKQTQKLNILCDYLRTYYLDEQLVCIYEAAILPTLKPRIEWIKLRELKQAVVTAVSTLYIPPITQQGVSQKYLDLLEMDAQNFKLSNKTHTSSK
ncbi:SAM-dependent methyltransferase [Legionella pneumophila]|uniref:SAM-dependent methyltransferase n=1 Tax=Legionella pneumophila TaxID=446 RepID=UPI003A4C50A6